MTLIELKKKRAELLSKAREIYDKADAEGRSVTKEEQKTFDDCMHDADKLKLDIESYDSDKSAGRVGVLERSDGPSGETTTVDASELRFVRHDEQLTKVYNCEQEARDFNVAKYIKGIVTNDWGDAELEHRALQSYLGAQGSILIPLEVSRDIWDLARNKSICFQAGAQTVEMPTAKLLIGKITADPTPAWKAEAATATADSTLAFGALELQARTLFLWLESSRELWSDATMLDQQVRNAIAQSMALELDRTILLGSGAGEEPEGVYNNANVTQTAVTATAYDDCSDAIYRVEAANHVATSTIWSARTQNYLRKRQDGEGYYIPFPDWLPKVYTTNQVSDTLGAGSNESIVVIGDMSKVLVGIRNNLMLEGTTEGSTLKSAYKMGLAAIMRADVGIIQPAALEVITGVLSAWNA